jgi:hypothetical protein
VSIPQFEPQRDDGVGADAIDYPLKTCLEEHGSYSSIELFSISALPAAWLYQCETILTGIK